MKKYRLPSFQKIKRFYDKKSLQFVIAFSFTVIALAGMGILGASLYISYMKSSREIVVEDNTRLVHQVALNLTTYMRNMMVVSDTMYYSVIKNTDISQDNMDQELNLLYEANKDYVVSIACFTTSGDQVAAAPITNMKKKIEVTEQEWFKKAQAKVENHHFSTPHVQNLFVESNYKYSWVVSLSRGIELTRNGRIQSGVLLVDMNYNGIEQLFAKANTSEISYIYLTDGTGKIIYHPKQSMINASLYQENNNAVGSYEDGVHYETFEGEERMVLVQTIGYTGWKIVNVIPTDNMSPSISRSKIMWIFIIAIVAFLLIFANNFMSSQVTKPLRKLDDSVREIENNYHDPQIFIGGSYEIQHLGNTILTMVKQMQTMMDTMVKEQEEKRKSELDALQSQINPHFLYNTLDSIIWMVESGRYEESIDMVSALASLFRISLSQGKTIISIEDEIIHARNYISIQKVRYKNKFQVEFAIEEEIKHFQTIKLIVQPILENAIYYGMEAMDGEGEIKVAGYSRGNDIYIEVRDNGLGMPETMVESLLTDSKRIRKKGSGIGLVNVHKRIQLYFGENYGLVVQSELDEGTVITIHLPKKLLEDL